ncbi:nucleotide exchange factor GrpE [Candidatus Kaiserbacteria bacterium]|nr:nucleotide exchange factor GrpE [Candidatus Kaiserbacteria bacterium]
MVNKQAKEDTDIEVEITNEDYSKIAEPELVENEAMSSDKIKKIKEKLKLCEEDRRQLQDELQRAKAEFLNARKRLDDDRTRDRIRFKIEHILDLLPLCDSFEMAMANKETWEKVDESWRAGIEGILGQLNKILENNNVKTINPKGEQFDPYKHEAIGTEEVQDEKLVDVVISVVQKGYELQTGDKTEIIRHARVTTGTKSEK